MPVALTTEPQEYTLKADLELPEEQRTVFLLRPLGSRQQMRLSDKVRRSATEWVEIAGDKVPVVENLNELSYERTLLGLAGWKNFHYANGDECVFDEKDREANLDKLDAADIHELGFAILRLSSLDEGAVKN